MVGVRKPLGVLPVISSIVTSSCRHPCVTDAGPLANQLKRRLTSLDDLRDLTDGEADLLLGSPLAELVISGLIVWTNAAAHRPRGETRMSVAVENRFAERLALSARISSVTPWRSHWVVVWGKKEYGERPAVLRRLDLRDSHHNPDGQEWINKTHKHRWSRAEANLWAYTPADIPHDPSPFPDGRDDYRAVCEAFASECGITLGPGYVWSEPSFVEQDDHLWEAP